MIALDTLLHCKCARKNPRINVKHFRRLGLHIDTTGLLSTVPCWKTLGYLYPRLQGLSQDLETGCPKFVIAKFLGILFFKGDHNILVTTINMYLIIEIRHNILRQCHGNHTEVENFQLYA